MGSAPEPSLGNSGFVSFGLACSLAYTFILAWVSGPESLFIPVITSDNEVMFLVLFVSLSVCLFVCLFVCLSVC